MRILPIFTILFFCQTFLSAAFLQFSPSAKLAAVSDISAFEEGPASCFYNPAVFKNGLSLSSSYFSPFAISDLSYKNVVAGYKWKKFNFSFAFQEFGNKIYKEQTGIVSTNIDVVQNLSFGICYRFLQRSVSAMKAEIASQFDVGMMATVRKLQFSSSFLNIGFNKIGNDTLPQESRTEISYQIYENIKTGICFVKELDYPFSFHFGTTYYPKKMLGIISGFQTEPDRFSAGLEFNLKKIQITYSIKTHQYLGLTHHFTICYQ